MKLIGSFNIYRNSENLTVQVYDNDTYRYTYWKPEKPNSRFIILNDNRMEIVHYWDDGNPKEPIYMDTLEENYLNDREKDFFMKIKTIYSNHLLEDILLKDEEDGSTDR